MGRMSGFSIFRALGSGTKLARQSGAFATDESGAPGRLSGSSLEQAYRDLLLENQVLVESNQRLHERLARTESGLEESPAAKQLIRSQRNALADRSHKLRELAYEVKRLQRDKKKLVEENRRMSDQFTRKSAEVQFLVEKSAGSQRELVELKNRLVQNRRELAMLRDRYYQLEANSAPQGRSNAVANGDF